jgi:hypothetical protein
MSVVVGCAMTAALLALGAGLAKLASPRTAVAAMRSARLPASDLLVRVGSLAEISLGVVVLLQGAWLACAVLGIAYVGFAVFSLVAVRAGRATPCGCFGPRTSVIGWRHVVTNLVLAAGLCATAADRGPSAVSLVRLSPSLGAASLVVAVVAAVLAATFLSGPMASARPAPRDA